MDIRCLMKKWKIYICFTKRKSGKIGRKLFKLYLSSVGKIAHFFLMFLRRIKVLSIIKMFMPFNLFGKKNQPYNGCSYTYWRIRAKLTDKDGWVDFDFGSSRKLKYIVLKEDIRKSQRVEKFDVYIKKQTESIYKGQRQNNYRICRIIRIKCCKNVLAQDLLYARAEVIPLFPKSALRIIGNKKCVVRLILLRI